MAQIDELVDHLLKIHDEINDEIRHWRKNKLRLTHNNRDVTEEWLAEQQRRADRLAEIAVAYKP